MRWMGGQRVVVEAVKRISKMQRYAGRIAFIPAQKEGDPLPPRCKGYLDEWYGLFLLLVFLRKLLGFAHNTFDEICIII